MPFRRALAVASVEALCVSKTREGRSLAVGDLTMCLGGVSKTLLLVLPLLSRGSKL